MTWRWCYILCTQNQRQVISSYFFFHIGIYRRCDALRFGNDAIIFAASADKYLKKRFDSAMQIQTFIDRLVQKLLRTSHSNSGIG